MVIRNQMLEPDIALDGPAPDARRHQIRARAPSLRTIGSPSLQPNVFANSGMFDERTVHAEPAG